MKLSFNPNINNKIIIYTSVFSLIIIGIIVFSIYPLFTKLGTLNKDLYDNRVQLAIYQKQRLNIDETRAEYNNIKSNIENITSVLVNRDDLLTFIDSLDTFALNANVVQKINLNNLDATANTENLQMSISLNGSWENINKYLYSIENSDYYIIIDNLSLIKNDSGNINTDFNLAVYLE